MTEVERKNVEDLGETNEYPKAKMSVVTVGNLKIGKGVFEPGWRWSESIGPGAGADSCPVTHTGYAVSGRLQVAMDDGSETVFGPGDAMYIPAGHDGWVIGDEPFVMIEIMEA